jgi:hypothetical protein
MEEMDAEEAQALANGVSAQDLAGGNQMAPELGIRKADSHKYGQLIGGDDEEELEDQSYPH